MGMSKVPLPFTPNGAVSVPIFTRRLNLPEFFTVSGRPLLKLTVTCPKSILLVVMRIRPNGGVGVAVGVRVGVAVAVGVSVAVAVGVAPVEVAVGVAVVVAVGVALTVGVADAVGV